MHHFHNVDKKYLADELNQLLPNVEAPGFVLKEKLEDPDVGMILQLLQDEPDLKKALVELHLMAPKRKSFYSDTITTFIKIKKNIKTKCNTHKEAAANTLARLPLKKQGGFSISLPCPLVFYTKKIASWRMPE